MILLTLSKKTLFHAYTEFTIPLFSKYYEASVVILIRFLYRLSLNTSSESFANEIVRTRKISVRFFQQKRTNHCISIKNRATPHNHTTTQPHNHTTTQHSRSDIAKMIQCPKIRTIYGSCFVKSSYNCLNLTCKKGM